MYESRALTDQEYHDIIDCIRYGYLEHKPNEQIATILTLEANLGCRINDIIGLTTDSFICDNGIWKLNIKEQKTKKPRYFIVPIPVKTFIDQWIEKRNLGAHERLFSISAAAVWKAMRQVTDFLDLGQVSTHGLRKNAAGRIYESTGHDIQAVAQFLNHSSTSITMRYLKRSDDTLEKAIENSILL